MTKVMRLKMQKISSYGAKGQRIRDFREDNDNPMMDDDEEANSPMMQKQISH